jgi:hypothetical protein
MVFLVRPSDEEAKRRMAVNGFSSIKESETEAVENKDHDNRFFFRCQGYCSSRICSARANYQPRIIHLRTQAYV